MKHPVRILLLISLLLLVVGCTNQSPIAGEAANEVNSKNLRMTEVELPDMFCFSCAISSERAFKGMKGVISAEVDSDTKKGTVIYDASIITKEQLMEHKLIQAYGGKISNDQLYTQ